MKKILFILIIFLSLQIKAQRVFEVQNINLADVRVFITPYISEADLLVYVEDYQGMAQGNKGLWYFERYESQADKKIHFVKYQSNTNLKIHYVKYRSQAGWVNKSKQSLLR